MIIATGDGQELVAAGNCIDYSRCYGQLSCRVLRPGGVFATAEDAYASDVYGSVAAIFQPGTHTVLMRVEAQPESEDDWVQFNNTMVPPGNEDNAYFVYAAFKIDLGGWRGCAVRWQPVCLQPCAGCCCSSASMGCIAASQIVRMYGVTGDDSLPLSAAGRVWHTWCELSAASRVVHLPGTQSLATKVTDKLAHRLWCWATSWLPSPLIKCPAALLLQ